MDHTIQNEKSMLTLAENVQTSSFYENPDTQRAYNINEENDLFQYQTQSYLKNTANKEKATIKNLMKEQYGEDTLSYHKGKA